MTEQELIKKLEQLREYITLTPEEEEAGLNLFMQKVNEKFAPKYEVEPVQEMARRPVFSFVNFTGTLGQSREFMYRALRVYSSHIFASVMITILVFGVFGAYSGMSARKALPDNRPLYTLKRALEKTQLTLSFSSTQRTALRINHLDRRVEEINHLVAKTKANPERDGVAVVKAIRNTQNDLNAVKKDLVAVAENEVGEDVTELKELAEEKVSRYQIALGVAHEDLPDDIKNEIEPEVAALSSTISEINDVISQLEAAEEATEQEIANPFDMGATTSDTVIMVTSSASSTITSTVELIGEVEGDMVAIEATSTQTLENEANSELPAYAPPVPVEEEFSLEKDTFKVRIGN